jgi:hypothetical protein
MQTIRLADLPAGVQVKITAAQASGEKVLILDADGAVTGNITAIPNRSGFVDRGIQIGHGTATSASETAAILADPEAMAAIVEATAEDGPVPPALAQAAEDAWDANPGGDRPEHDGRSTVARLSRWVNRNVPDQRIREDGRTKVTMTGGQLYSLLLQVADRSYRWGTDDLTYPGWDD